MTATLLLVLLTTQLVPAAPWVRHLIDAGGHRGADGVKLADADGDGLPDIVTGWEEGGLIRLAFNPGVAAVRQPWPALTVGRVSSPEDAVLTDIDGDGALDVISCCEGATRQVFVHWAPAEPGRYRDETAWRTDAIPCTAGRRWMYCLPFDFDGQRGLVIGGKNERAEVGWLEVSANPRDVASWRYHALCPAGWIMSLKRTDFNGDGRPDIILTDRHGPRRGLNVLLNLGPARLREPWPQLSLGGAGYEVLFLTPGPSSGGRRSVVVGVKGSLLLLCSETAEGWTTREIPLPDTFGGGKGVAVGDLDLDGEPDLAFTCESASGAKSGVGWLSGGWLSGQWLVRDIGGPEGVKFDRLELLDLDGDGDLDLLTCEEVDNLGVIWYENPTR